MSDRKILMLEKASLTCVDVFQLWGEEHDNDLGESLSEKIALHTAHCQPCNKFCEEYEQLMGLVSELRTREYVQTETDRSNLRAALAERLGL
jgi:hypothetical protein